MKKSELKQLIKEEIKKILSETQFPPSHQSKHKMAGLKEAIEPLFPDVLKVRKDTEITSNANNERDILPAGEYKSTEREFDGMHIYKSEGKNWFLYPEDMDILNDTQALT